MNITKLIIDNQISKMEKDSIIILDNKEQVLDTIYLYDKSSNSYLQFYYDKGEFNLYKEHNQLPTNKILITDYSTVLINKLKLGGR